MVSGGDRLRKIAHKQIKNDAGVIMSTAENEPVLSVKITKTQKTRRLKSHKWFVAKVSLKTKCPDN